jgi:hypothetical protein
MPAKKKTKAAAMASSPPPVGVIKKKTNRTPKALKTNDDSFNSFYHSGNNGTVAPQGQQNLSKLFDKYRGQSSSHSSNRI